MRTFRRLLLAAMVSASAFVGFGLATATPASALCDTGDGCSPCTFEVVIEGKNSRIEWHQC